MPRRSDLNHVLVIGSGPIVIGQACEFDYSGTQACRVLRSEGIPCIVRRSFGSDVPDFLAAGRRDVV